MRKLGTYAATAGMTLWLLLQVYPLVFMAMTSLKSEVEILNAPFSWPSELRIENYFVVLQGSRTSPAFWQSLLNSCIVTAVALVLLVIIGSAAGYALARGPYASGRTRQLVLLVLAVPVQVLLVPTYSILNELGLKNNLVVLGMVYAAHGLPFTIILFRSYFITFPREIEEAARLDGLATFGTFARIVLPISKSALFSIAIINVGWIWSELLFAQVLLDRAGTRTLPSAIAGFRPSGIAGQTGVGQLFAVMTLTVIPLLIIYFVFQRQIREGATAGAIK